MKGEARADNRSEQHKAMMITFRGVCFVLPRPLIANALAINPKHQVTPNTVQIMRISRSLKLCECCESATLMGVVEIRSAASIVVFAISSWVFTRPDQSVECVHSLYVNSQQQPDRKKKHVKFTAILPQLKVTTLFLLIYSFMQCSVIEKKVASGNLPKCIAVSIRNSLGISVFELSRDHHPIP